MTGAGAARVGEVVAAVREVRPLVHCLTATVSMALVADGLLAGGARPMMTETLEEAPHLVRRADAMLANLGTLSSDGAQGIPATARVAVERGLPWVLDPAAIGPAPLRVRLAGELLRLGPTVVRANASEVLVLAGRGRGGRGPDSSDAAADVLPVARELAAANGCVVAVSGATDLVTDGDRVVAVHNGVEMLTRVTGTGCLLGALTAACCAAAPDAALEAAVAATVWLGVAGERALPGARGPAGLRSGLVDWLYALTEQQVATAARLEES